jgi:nucleotide-binding universal stress UspA family protein
MKAILVPTDFSECAGHARELAEVLARESGAHLYFFHMFSDYSEPVHVPHSSEYFVTRHPKEGKHRAQLNSWVQQAERAGITCSSIFVYDHGTDKVLDYMESYEIDLVILGSHGIGGLREWVMGSNARYLARHSHIPVIVVKEKIESPIQSILFPSLFEEDVTDEVDKITSIARYLNAQVDLLYLEKDPGERRRDEGLNILKKYQSVGPDCIDSLKVIKAENELSVINRYIQENKIDMVAIRRDEYDISMFPRNISNSLLKHHKLPILVL